MDKQDLLDALKTNRFDKLSASDWSTVIKSLVAEEMNHVALAVKRKELRELSEFAAEIPRLGVSNALQIQTSGHGGTSETIGASLAFEDDLPPAARRNLVEGFTQAISELLNAVQKKKKGAKEVLKELIGFAGMIGGVVYADVAILAVQTDSLDQSIRADIALLLVEHDFVNSAPRSFWEEDLKTRAIRYPALVIPLIAYYASDSRDRPFEVLSILGKYKIKKADLERLAFTLSRSLGHVVGYQGWEQHLQQALDDLPPATVRFLLNDVCPRMDGARSDEVKQVISAHEK